MHSNNQQENYPVTVFIFLSYNFRPRKAVGEYVRVYVNFVLVVSRDALKVMRQTIWGWHLQLKYDKMLRDLSQMFNSVLREWMGIAVAFMVRQWSRFGGI